MNTTHQFSLFGIAFQRIALTLLAVAILALPAQAQFTGNNQTNITSGVTSNWQGDCNVGSNN